MRQYMPIPVLMLATIFCTARPAGAQSRTFYISYSTGSNSNPGTQAAPWKTHPYMSTGTGCTGSGAGPSYSHQAGDHFIFKGGDTWPGACLPLSIKASGTVSAGDYYGVDKSWFEAGAWTRPKFDAQYTNVNNMVNANGITYVTIDGIEFAHQGIAPSTSFSTSSCGIFFGQVGYGGWRTGTIIEDVYIHDWAVTSNLNPLPAANFDNICIGGIMGVAEVSKVEISGAGAYAYWQNAKVDEPFGGGVSFAGEGKDSKIHDGWNGCTTTASCHDNDFYGIEQNSLAGDVGVHSQVIEDNEPCPTTPGNKMAVYNNVIHDNRAGVNIFVRYFADVYNNVMWNNTNNNQIRLCVPDSDNASSVGHVFNNTMDVAGGNEGGVAIAERTNGTSGALGTLYIQNNIVVNGTTVFAISAATEHYSNNYAMTSSEALAHGFTSATQYAPTSSDTNVTSSGVNFTAACASLIALCHDAGGAFWFGGSYVARPSTGSWMLGAFASGAQSVATPAAPTGLIAVLQ